MVVSNASDDDPRARPTKRTHLGLPAIPVTAFRQLSRVAAWAVNRGSCAAKNCASGDRLVRRTGPFAALLATFSDIPTRGAPAAAGAVGERSRCVAKDRLCR